MTVSWKPTHEMPARPMHCHVCAAEGSIAFVCPEHGPRCWDHVDSHAFCKHPKQVVGDPRKAPEHVCDESANHLEHLEASRASQRVEIEGRLHVLGLPVLLML